MRKNEYGVCSPQCSAISVKHCCAGKTGLIPLSRRVDTLDKFPVNHSLTTTRCKVGNSPLWEGRIWSVDYNDYQFCHYEALGRIFTSGLGEFLGGFPAWKRKINERPPWSFGEVLIRLSSIFT